ncbi:hypothetical protein [Methyloligella halotolerans]|nr:hypothetical protein [Methyloligella halotolerans]
MALLGSALGAAFQGASAGELKRVESAALERYAMHSGVDGGMWTHYVPKDVNGEFDSYDPIGLIAGSLIKADCSISWQDDAGRVYCFASNSSLVHFQEWPRTNVEKARKAWITLSENRRPQS